MLGLAVEQASLCGGRCHTARWLVERGAVFPVRLPRLTTPRSISNTIPIDCVIPRGQHNHVEGTIQRDKSHVFALQRRTV